MKTLSVLLLLALSLEVVLNFVHFVYTVIKKIKAGKSVSPGTEVRMEADKEEIPRKRLTVEKTTRAISYDDLDNEVTRLTNQAGCKNNFQEQETTFTN